MGSCNNLLSTLGVTQCDPPLKDPSYPLDLGDALRECAHLEKYQASPGSLDCGYNSSASSILLNPVRAQRPVGLHSASPAEVVTNCRDSYRLSSRK